jgi:ATP synthase subunit 6
MTKIKKIIQQKWSVQYNSYFIVLLILSFTSVISFQQIFIPTFIKLYIRNYQKNVFFNITSINMVFVDSICCILTAILVIYFFETRLNILLNSPSIFPNIYQYIIENINNFILNLLNSIMERKKESQILFPSIYALFIVLLITNVQGMVPYSFTLASHLIDTFFLALTFFSFIIVTILIRNNTKYFLTIFMPAGSPFNLAFLLIPLEVISYFFRVLSLSVRLFANMMAGHILLKVILGFAWMMMFAGETLCLASTFPILTLFVLTLLEFGVAMIQAYIFTILICIYLKDAFFAH